MFHGSNRKRAAAHDVADDADADDVEWSGVNWYLKERNLIIAGRRGMVWIGRMGRERERLKCLKSFRNAPRRRDSRIVSIIFVLGIF